MKMIFISAAVAAAMLSGTAVYAQSTGTGDNSSQGSTVGGTTDGGVTVESPTMLGGFFTDDTQTEAMAETEMEAAFMGMSSEDQQAAVEECNQLKALEPAESPGNTDATFEARADVCETVLGIQF